jgi:hypothetical protein
VEVAGGKELEMVGWWGFYTQVEVPGGKELEMVSMSISLDIEGSGSVLG